MHADNTLALPTLVSSLSGLRGCGLRPTGCASLFVQQIRDNRQFAPDVALVIVLVVRVGHEVKDAAGSGGLAARVRFLVLVLVLVLTLLRRAQGARRLDGLESGERNVAEELVGRVEVVSGVGDLFDGGLYARLLYSPTSLSSVHEQHPSQSQSGPLAAI